MIAFLKRMLFAKKEPEERKHMKKKLKQLLIIFSGLCLMAGLCCPLTAMAELSTSFLEGVRHQQKQKEKDTGKDAKNDTDQKEEEEAFFEWEGYRAEPTWYRIYKSSNSTPTLYLYFRIINGTERLTDLWFYDMEIDGTPVMCTGIYDIDAGVDTGEDSEEYCMVFPKQDSAEKGTEAILNAKEVKTTLVLKQEAENKDDPSVELYRKDVVIDLTDMDSEKKIEKKQSETQPVSQPETQPETKANKEPQPDYRTLFEGSTGEDVRRLQGQLILLGYLNDVADGIYGPNTARAVRDFCEANGLGSGEMATYNMQVLLFSGDAEAKQYYEDWIPLQLGQEFSWDPIPEVNTFFFKVQVTNTSSYRTIKGYELSVYYEDVWGTKLDGGVTYTQTMTQTVYPGETVYSGNFNLGNWYSVDTVWVGISKIVFDDGEIREPDVIEYHSCVLPSRIN